MTERYIYIPSLLKQNLAHPFLNNQMFFPSVKCFLLTVFILHSFLLTLIN